MILSPRDIFSVIEYFSWMGKDRERMELYYDNETRGTHFGRGAEGWQLK